MIKILRLTRVLQLGRVLRLLVYFQGTPTARLFSKPPYQPSSSSDREVDTAGYFLESAPHALHVPEQGLNYNGTIVDPRKRGSPGSGWWRWCPNSCGFPILWPAFEAAAQARGRKAHTLRYQLRTPIHVEVRTSTACLQGA